MSENLDLVRSIYAEWERGDYSSVEWATPRSSSHSPTDPTPAAGRASAGMAEGWRAS